MPAPDTFTAWKRLSEGKVDTARALVREALSHGPSPIDIPEWARVAEAAGDSFLAIELWKRLAEAQPSTPTYRERARVLHEERTGAAPDPDPVPQPEATAADLARFVELFGGRAGVHARMWRRGRSDIGYSPVRASLSSGLVAAHLRGDQTLGSYVVRHGDVGTQLIFDIDIRKKSLQRSWGDPEAIAHLRSVVDEAGRELLVHLRGCGLDPLLVDSGFKGRHLWCILQHPQPAGLIRDVGHALLTSGPEAHPQVRVEVFPKQARVPAGGLGNLVKLPMGLHLRTDRRCVLLDDAGRPHPRPWDRLRSLRRTALPRMGGPAPAPGSPSAPKPPSPPPATPPPAVPAAAASFTEGDFDGRPRLAALLDRCPVLAEVVREALEEGRLERDAGVVLQHTMGHLPEGVEAVNYLVGRCGASSELGMGKPHRGSPSSCARIRRRLPAIVGRVPCACDLSHARSYPSPIRHIEDLPPPRAEPLAVEGAPTEAVVESLASLMSRQQRLEAELRATRRLATERLSELPDGTLSTAEGQWQVRSDEGLPTLHFRPGKSEAS